MPAGITFRNMEQMCALVGTACLANMLGKCHMFREKWSTSFWRTIFFRAAVKSSYEVAISQFTIRVDPSDDYFETYRFLDCAVGKCHIFREKWCTSFWRIIWLRTAVKNAYEVSIFQFTIRVDSSDDYFETYQFWIVLCSPHFRSDYSLLLFWQGPYPIIRCSILNINDD